MISAVCVNPSFVESSLTPHSHSIIHWLFRSFIASLTHHLPTHPFIFSFFSFFIPLFMHLFIHLINIINPIILSSTQLAW